MKDEEFADGIVAILHGVDYLLGGKHDYTCGIDYKNDVFETHSFWAHAECSCHVESQEWDISERVEARLAGMGLVPPEILEPDSGYWETYTQVYEEYEPAYNLEHTCDIDEPHFRHFDSGLEVRWYKRVGRSTKSNFSMKDLDWYRIVVECLESLKDAREAERDQNWIASHAEDR